MTVATVTDAVVIGAGPNGLVAANTLLDAGWSVRVVEANAEIGGAVRSDRAVHPDYVHDTFSAFYPLGAASPAIAGLGLEEYGLRWLHAPAVVGHPLPDGGWALLHRDRQATAAGLEANAEGDGEAWLRLCQMWDGIGPSLVRALLAPFPPSKAGLDVALRIPRAGGLSFVKAMMAPATTFCDTYFRGEAARALILGNAGHTDIPLNAPGSALMGVLLCMLGQTVGFPVPECGAGMLSAAMWRRAADRGAQLERESVVTRIGVEGGRAATVHTVDGRVFRARRAVLADVSAPALYEGLLDASDVPASRRRAMVGFAWDPGTVKVDWALDGPVPWATTPAAAPGTVHIARSERHLLDALAQVSVGIVPAHPYLLAGQMTTADPSRSPSGTESLWAYSHVPQRIGRDEAGEGLTGVWDEAEAERFADRIQAEIEHFAPGFGRRVRARRVLGPREMQAMNRNLVGGAVNGGSSQLHQQLIFRPTPGWGRPETGVRGLYLASASAHPGGGVHGACGRNAARAAILASRLRRLRGR